MNRRAAFFGLLLVVLAAACFLPTGCKVFDSNPSGPDAAGTPGVGQTAPVVGTARSVSFRVVLPGASSAPIIPSGDPAANVIAGIQAQTATASPTVTFKLILVNVGDTANPTTTLTKTVPVLNGAATGTFQAVPARTAIGDVTITNGNVGGSSAFHGAADLTLVENVIVVAPKGSRLTEDFIAHIAEQLTGRSDLFPKTVYGLVARIKSAIATLNVGATTAFDDAVNLYLASLAAPPSLTQEDVVVAPVKETIIQGLTTGNLDQAVSVMAPEVQASVRQVLEESATVRSELAAALQTASMTFVSGDGVSGTYDGSLDQARYGEMTVLYDGQPFKIMMEKVDGRWVIRGL